jgi:hypothetical protein
MKIPYFLESFLKSREDETKSFSYKPKTIQSEVIFKLLDWMVLVISSVLFLNVLIRAKRNCHNLVISVQKAALSTLRQKYSKILNSIFEISERNARS